MLQNFLDGKKKYSALIITLAAAVIPVLIQDPETQKTVLDLVPSLAAVIAGVFYIVTQGKIDGDKIKAQVVNEQAKTVQAAQLVAEQASVTAQAATQVADTQATPAEENIPLDLKLFHERVLSDTLARHSEQNPATVFYTAKDKGGTTTCHDIKQAQDYWDYLITLVYDAEQYVRETTEVDKPGQCKVRSPEHVLIQSELSNTIRYRDNVYTLAQTTINWRRQIEPNDTLYHVGVLAADLLKAAA